MCAINYSVDARGERWTVVEPWWDVATGKDAWYTDGSVL